MKFVLLWWEEFCWVFFRKDGKIFLWPNNIRPILLTWTKSPENSRNCEIWREEREWVFLLQSGLTMMYGCLKFCLVLLPLQLTFWIHLWLPPTNFFTKVLSWNFWSLPKVQLASVAATFDLFWYGNHSEELSALIFKYDRITFKEQIVDSLVNK